MSPCLLYFAVYQSDVFSCCSDLLCLDFVSILIIRATTTIFQLINVFTVHLYQKITSFVLCSALDI